MIEFSIEFYGKIHCGSRECTPDVTSRKNYVKRTISLQYSYCILWYITLLNITGILQYIIEYYRYITDVIVTKEFTHGSTCVAGHFQMMHLTSTKVKVQHYLHG